jgi:PAB1-binding protein PBP1
VKVRLTDPPNDDQSLIGVNAPPDADEVGPTESRDLVHIQQRDRCRSPPPPVQSVDTATDVATKNECDIEEMVRSGNDPAGIDQSIAASGHGESNDQLVEEETGKKREPFQEADSVTSCRLSDDSGVIDGGSQRDEHITPTTAEPGPSFDVTYGHGELEMPNSVVSVILRSNSSVSDPSTLATVSVDEKPTMVAPPVGHTQNIRPTATVANASQIGEQKANGTEPYRRSTITINERLVTPIF